MNTVVPIVIIIALGAFSGFVLRRFRWPFLIRAGMAALLACAIWSGGIYVMLALTAPSELGFPLPRPILMTFLTALVPALIVCGIIRTKTLED